MFWLGSGRMQTVGVGSAVAVLALVGAPAAQATVPVSYAASTAVAAQASMDWSGYDVTGGSYTSVTAAWTVPAVTCSAGESSYSADWVGLDGDGSDAVEQIGTSSDCDSGTPAYSAWYEFYPSVSVSLPNEVRAGDRITASVAAAAAGQFTVTLTDTTAKWTVSRTASSPAGSGASAEVIAEAPSGSAQSGSVLPLADFKRVTFTGVKVDGSGIASTPGAHSIAMVDATGAPMATVSTVSADSSFGVTWVSSGATAAAEATGGRGYAGGGTSGDGTSGDGTSGDGTSGGWGSSGWSGGWGTGGWSGDGSAGGDTGGWGYWGDAAGAGGYYWQS